MSAMDKDPVIEAIDVAVDVQPNLSSLMKRVTGIQLYKRIIEDIRTAYIDQQKKWQMRVAELEAQLANAQKPRTMKRYVDEKPKESGWYFYKYSAKSGVIPAFYCRNGWQEGHYEDSLGLCEPEEWCEMCDFPRGSGSALPETSGDITGGEV